MEVLTNIETENEVTKNIRFEIPREMVNDEVTKKLAKVAASAQLKGFRKGKVPRDYISKLYGDTLRSEALSELLNTVYSKTIAENNLRVIGYPEVDFQNIEGEGNVTATAKVSLIPEPEINNYFNESFEVEVASVDESSVQKELERYQEQFSKIEDVADRTKVQDGDIVIADYSGTVEGNARDDLKGEGAFLELKEGRTRDELRNALIGSELNSAVTVSIEMAQDVQDKEIAGKTVEYTVTPRKIQTRVLHELNDELAELTKRAKTIDELQKTTRTQLETSANNQNKAAKEAKLFEQLIEKNSFMVPQGLIDEEIRQMLMEYGVLDPRKEESYQRDITPFRESLSGQAEKRVRRDVIVSQLVKKEGLETSDEELENWLNKRAEELSVSRDEVNKMYSYPQAKKRLNAFVSEQRMVEKLLEKANITEIPQKEAK